MPKLEEILKKQGWSDADLEAQAAVLSDPRFRGALEAELGAVESQVESYKAENERWAKWHEEEGKPLLSMYERDKADAVARAAALEARLKLAEEQGYAPRREDQPVVTTQPAQAEAFDPKKHNLITRDDVNQLAEMEARAIALATDLAEDYRTYTGKPITEYSTVIDGRQMRGMTALREEAKAAKQPLDQYISRKFDFEGKRNAISTAQQKAAEDAIRADERAKVAAQYGNPESRTLMPSREPFIPRAGGGDGKAPMPWEVPSQERSRARIERAMQTQMKAVLQ